MGADVLLAFDRLSGIFFVFKWHGVLRGGGYGIAIEFRFNMAGYEG